jgi:hypothetical protein
MSDGFRLWLIWLLAAAVTVFITLQLTSASYFQGQFLPVGQDAFYHARRILDAVSTGHVYQYDAMMQVPEGGWITWPWAYDAAMAMAVRVVTQLLPVSDPVMVLMHLPPLLSLLALACLAGICRELRLPAVLTLFVAFCFALSAYTAYQFGVGSLDHHGAEQVATLGALWLGLRWLSRPESGARGSLLGLWLGLALGVHTGMFMLQIPLLAAVAISWWRGTLTVTFRSTGWFALGLLLGTLLILAPADTFWSSRFDVYYLSGLQLYVSACTCLVMLYVSRNPRTPRSLWRLLALCALLAIPLLSAIGFSGGFLSGKLATISNIDEIRSPFAIALQDGGLRRISQIYTLLIWTMPLAWIASVVMVLRSRETHRLYFWTACTFGLSLLPLQLRMASFSVFYLYLPLIVLAAIAIEKWVRARAAILAGLVAALGLAYFPTVRYQLFGPNLPAGERQFATLQPILPALRDACAKDPGVVLAEPGDGHMIRYFTECSVIANNFRLTPLDVSKVTEAFELIGLPVEQLRLRAPSVKYVVARLVAPVETEHPVLFEQLLQSEQLPGDVEPLVQLTVTHDDGRTEKFLGAYRLH